MTELTMLDFCKALLPDMLDWPAVRTLAFVRHPCSRLYSGFRHSKREGWLPAAMTFRDFVLGYPDNVANYSSPRHVLWHTWCSQYQLLGEDALSKHNFVGRYEQLRAEMRRLLAWLGTPTAAAQRLLHIGRTRHANPSQPYDREMLAVVADRFAADFALFSYAVP